MMKKYFVFLLFLFLLNFPITSWAKDNLSRQKISYDGIERSFYYFIPKQLNNEPMPLVLGLHGGGKSEGDGYAQRTRYVSHARKHKFIVVFPNGIDAQWNDGRGKTFRMAEDNTHINDTGFLAKVIDLFVSKHEADPSRVYIDGTSNGGMMTYRMACEYSDKITAVAATISSMPKKIFPKCRPKSPVGVLSMNGVDDPWVPFDGGTVEVGFGRKKQKTGEIISTYENIEFWSKHNGCAITPKIERLPDTAPDKTNIIKKTYPDCEHNVHVELYEIHGGGHSRPDMVGRVPARLLGNKSEDIDATEVIWSFFSQHGN